MLELYAIDSHEVYEKHAADKTDGSEYSDRREVLHGVETVSFQTGICH